MSRVIVNPAEYDTKVSAFNKRLVGDFLIEKKSQRKAVRTIKQYENDMRIINTLVYRHFDNKDLTELTRKDIRNLAIVFQERGMSNARVNRIMSCLRSCLEFAADDDDYDYEFNQGSRVKGLPKSPVREITFLTEEQINWLRDTLVEKGDTLRAVYLMLSYYSAARKNEVHQVKKDGLTDRYFTNKVVGKRGKRFHLYYNEEVRQLIVKYLEERGEDGIPNLFVRVLKNGKRVAVSADTFNDWCDTFGKMLTEYEGKRVHVNPHCFRHSRLDNLSRNQKVPIEKLKTLANHESIETTASYLAERAEDDIAEIFGMSADNFV